MTKVESRVAIKFKSDGKVDEIKVWQDPSVRRPGVQDAAEPWRLGDVAEKKYSGRWHHGVVTDLDSQVTVLFEVDGMEDCFDHTETTLRMVAK